MSDSVVQAIKRRQARLTIYTELVFVLIPFVLIGLKNISFSILLNEEWALVASILFGQAAARLFTGIAKHKIKKWQLASLYAVVCVAMSLISIYVYSIIQDGNEGFSAYIVMQILLFLLSIITFIVFGSIGQRLLDMPEN